MQKLFPLLFVLAAACGDSDPPPGPPPTPDGGPAPVPEYHIELVTPDPDAWPPGAVDDLIWATARWSEVIVADVPDVSIPVRDQSDCGVSGVVDDLVILVEFLVIDGPGGVLGRAGPLCLRENLLTISGVMEFDVADYDPAFFRQTALHEIGHVVGIGTLWPDKNFLINPSCGAFGCISGIDVRYSGEYANREWRDLASTTSSVPVENLRGPGSSDAHWREDSPMENELMSPALSAFFEPLSRITVGAVEDLGYVVDYAAADPFVPQLSGHDGELPFQIPYGDERLHRPVYVFQSDGTRYVLRE